MNIQEWTEREQLLAAYDAYSQSKYEKNAGIYKAELASFLRDERIRILVAREQERIAAMLMLWIPEAGRGEILEFAVVKRARLQGIGSAMVQAVKKRYGKANRHRNKKPYTYRKRQASAKTWL